jgi:predicted AlkP superfamily pyrophosphatase or phosphodiesterase
MGKVILVVLDAMRNDTAAEQMGYLQHLVETQHASRYTVRGELPTLSRPTYETIQTGVPVSQHGITGNGVVRLSTTPHLFGLATANGLTTAASVTYWYSELYNHCPFEPYVDREIDDPTRPIQHGRFYVEDSTPDKEVFQIGELLRRRFAPDYLVIHPMGMDFLGEAYGSNSPEYRRNAVRQDALLAQLIPGWLESSYCVLVTSDHGIDEDRQHGGTKAGVRELPLYLIPAGGTGTGDTGLTVSQLQIAPTIGHLLGVPTPSTMLAHSLT